MRLIAAIAAAALGAAAFAASSAAHGTKMTPLRLYDLIDVLDSRIACEATIGTTSLKGKRLVGCYLVDDKGEPAVGSYAPALAADGEIVVVQVSKKVPVVFRRTLAGVGAAATGRYLEATVGSAFALNGTDLRCGVTRTERGITASCFKVAAGRRSANTYGFAVTNHTVSIIRVDGARRSHTVYTKLQPK